MIRCAVGLGSNLGEPRRNLEQAVARLDLQPEISILAASRLYHSEPWGDPDQDPFLNAVIVLDTTKSPRQLLEELQKIETGLGKRPIRKWGPRTLDLDLLLAGDQIIESPGLTVPHPYIRHRPFVYRPLQDVAGLQANWAPFTEPLPEGLELEKGTRPLESGPWTIWAKRFEPTLESAVVTTGEDQTLELAKALGRLLPPGSTVGLQGPLGAGKSVFARGIARSLGVHGPVQSPTFTLCREYDPPFALLQHWDFYRLEDEDELESAGFYSSPPGAIRIVEWADLFPSAIPDKTFDLKITPINAENRKINLARPSKLPFSANAIFR